MVTIKWLLSLSVVIALSALFYVNTGNGGEVPAANSASKTAQARSAALAAPQSPVEPAFLTDDERNNISVFRDASPSVVYVTNTQLRRRRFSYNVMEIPAGSGTGFIWDESGLIVTNFHVIYGANTISITLQSGKTYEATVVGTAPEKDIALLQIEAPDETLVAIPRGDSSNLAVGRKVLAIGNPFELDTTLTVGVVSALGREIKSMDNRTIKNVIQTDAAINPGNSGGPLLDSQGQLVGVNTSIISPSGGNAGIGFAIPVNTVKLIVPQLLQHGRLYRPVLGIEPLPAAWARNARVNGVAVMTVQKGLPADKAGMVGIREDRFGKLHIGDIIVAINDEPVTNEDSLLSQLEQYRPGDEVEVTTLRNDEIHQYRITLAKPE
jgi:S1-C subfamily serine protease